MLFLDRNIIGLDQELPYHFLCYQFPIDGWPARFAHAMHVDAVERYADAQEYA